jgi:hypothetical protein
MNVTKMARMVTALLVGEMILTIDRERRILRDSKATSFAFTGRKHSTSNAASFGGI